MDKQTKKQFEELLIDIEREFIRKSRQDKEFRQSLAKILDEFYEVKKKIEDDEKKTLDLL